MCVYKNEMCNCVTQGKRQQNNTIESEREREKKKDKN